jgi:hypothetical protein
MQDWLESGDRAKFARELPDKKELVQYIEGFAVWIRGIEDHWRGYSAGSDLLPPENQNNQGRMQPTDAPEGGGGE